MTGGIPGIAALHAAYRKGKPARDVVEAVYRRIAAIDDPGIFIHLADRDALLAEAEALGPFDPASRPLWGIPFAVKDNIDVAGMPTTAACPEFAYTPEADATVVRLLRAAGALVVGKTNLDQFATGLVGTRTPYPVPRNALDPALVPGGSSSGSAIAVAQGIVSLALGTDTAGSGRIPAGLNGLVGLKPSLGALSTRGVVPACRTLDCVSVFANDLADAQAVFDVAAAFDSRDPYSRPVGNSASESGAEIVRVGVPREDDRRFFGDAAAQEAYETFLARLQGFGIEIVGLPFQRFYDIAELLYEGPWVAERYAAIESFIANHEDALHPVTRAIITKARDFSAADAFRGLYALEALRREVAPLLGGIDLLCVPTAPTWYTVEENLADPIGTNSRLGTYTNFVNLLGLCGLTIPTGSQSDGRPASVTLLGHGGSDRSLVRFAEKVLDETDSGGQTRGDRTASADVAGNTIDIAVVGAHLSGMPLNHELTDLGAVFRRTVKTPTDYRLYALAGTRPQKPGLLRVAAGTGHAIEAEIWTLPATAFGRFVANIPAPLCVGRIRFDDGTSAQGFLVESEAVQGAEDVSDYGSWRRYIESQDAVA